MAEGAYFVTETANIRSIDDSSPDPVVISALSEYLEMAKTGELTAVVMIAGKRDGTWLQGIYGDSGYHSVAGLNLRVDTLKQMLVALAKRVDNDG